MKFHTFAEEYPLMPAYEMGRMEEAMRLRGFDPRFPIIIYDGKILDGRNRFKAAKAVGIEPIFDTFFGNDDQAKTFVAMANEERRHLAPEWLKRRREERIQRATTAHANGQSLREIAKEEGVSAKTIHEDLKSVTQVTPDGQSTEGNGEEEHQEIVLESNDAQTRGEDDLTERARKEKELWDRIRIHLASNPKATNKGAAKELGCSEHTVKKVKEKMADEWEAKQTVFCRDCRIGPKMKSCPKCKEKREDAIRNDGIPERLLPIFEKIDRFDSAANRALKLADLFLEIERSPAYKKGIEGKKSKAYSTFIRSAGLAILAIKPVKPCPDCGGTEEPNPDSEGCKTCKDRGYLMQEEVE